jgi:DNA-binding response OmpR family regulator
VTTVLVIDDEAAIRLLCRVNLEAEGMKVVEAADGQAGLERAREERPAVILLDVMMPGLDGWQVAEELVGGETTRDIPIVFLTARADFRDRERGFEAGGIAYLTKPFNPVELASLIRDLLARLASGDAAELRRERIAELRALVMGDGLGGLRPQGQRP